MGRRLFGHRDKAITWADLLGVVTNTVVLLKKDIYVIFVYGPSRLGRSMATYRLLSSLVEAISNIR